jgi:isopentenyl diphosphate isomerase/L-lactate dehydrogenase-like FMN-dependent dehydrogenase
MPEKAWAYYSSAADDEITNRENHAAYHRYVIVVYQPAMAEQLVA